MLCRANPPEVADFFSVSWFYIFNEFSTNPLYINLGNLQVKKNKPNTGFYTDFLVLFRCHCWVSFSGFSVAFNEVHDLITGKDLSGSIHSQGTEMQKLQIL